MICICGCSERTSAAGGVDKGWGTRVWKAPLTWQDWEEIPGLCEEAPASISSWPIVEGSSQPSSPLAKPPQGQLGWGQALLRDQGLCYSGSCLPRSQAPGSFPLRHLRHSVLLREESRGGAAGAPPWGKHASESQGWGWQGEGARAACQGGLPFSAEV